MKLRFFLSLCCALFLGIVLTLVVAPLHPWVNQQAGIIFKNAFQNALHCSVSCRVRRVHLLSPSIDVEHMVVCPTTSNDGGWSWQCKRYSMGFSWYHLLRYRKLVLWVDIDGLQATTEISNQIPAIQRHVQELLKGPQFPLPSVLQSITFTDACVTAQDASIGGNYFLRWKSDSKQLTDRFKSRVYVKDAKITVAGTTYCQECTGDVTVDIQGDPSNVLIAIYGDGRINVPQLTQDPWCFVTGVWEHNHARITLHNASKTVLLDPLILTKRSDGWWFDTQLQLPLSYVNALGLLGEKKVPAATNIVATMAGTLDSDWVHGEVTIPDLCLSSSFPQLTAYSTFEKKGSEISGDFTCSVPSLIEVGGNWTGDLAQGTGTFYGSPTIQLGAGKFGAWHINPSDAFIKGTITHDGTIEGNYAAVCTNTLSSKTVATKGIVHFTDPVITIKGQVDNGHTYELECGTAYPYIHNLFYRPDEKTVAVSLESYIESGVHMFDGLCTIPLVKTMLRELYQYEWQAEGSILFHGEFLATGAKAWVQLHEGTIQLPQTYNFINGFEGNVYIDIPARKLMVRDLCCTLHEGLARISQAVVYRDDQGHISYAHVPVVLDRCVLQLKKDLFAMISGSLFGEYCIGQIPTIKGSVILDRAQLKENIFADEFQKQLFKSALDTSATAYIPDIACNVTLETKEPIRVDTPFLKTNARLQVAITRSLANPQVIGKIKLLGGELKFPHKPLHITRGSIQFIPDQLSNPLVELVAKNTIKKNVITLYVSGALLNHQILLESTPPLTQEQIISLLVVGSHDDTLNSMMPAFIAHNIKQLIFGGHQSGLLDKYFKPIMRPLSINLVPSFSDHTGRGGLRAALEITVNDRWRALIQKNFSLTEDTRVELEYLFSDDVSVRAIRDERRDMGAEIEVRFKF